MINGEFYVNIPIIEWIMWEECMKEKMGIITEPTDRELHENIVGDQDWSTQDDSE